MLYHAHKRFHPTESNTQRAIIFSSGLVLNLSHEATYQKYNKLYQSIHGKPLDPTRIMPNLLKFDEEFAAGRRTTKDFVHFMRSELEMNEEQATDEQIIAAWNAMLGDLSDPQLLKRIKDIENLLAQHQTSLYLYSRTNEEHEKQFQSLLGKGKVATTCKLGIPKQQIPPRIIKDHKITQACLIVGESASPFPAVRERDNAFNKATIDTLAKSVSGVALTVVEQPPNQHLLNSIQKCLKSFKQEEAEEKVQSFKL